MNRSEQINELAAALAKAALSFERIERNCTAKVVTKKGGSYSYSYADLDDVLSAVRIPLAENGLTISHDCLVTYEIEQSPEGSHRVYSVETTCWLRHSSGQWISSSPLMIPCDGLMSTAQLIGSGCTYGKRYTTQDLLGLSTESDDDGNAASGNDAETGHRNVIACPKCGKVNTVIEGKPEYGGGLLCFGKKGGCGHKWHPAATEHGRQMQQELAAGLTDSERTVVATLRETITACNDFEVLVKIGEQIKSEFSPGIQSAIREFYKAKHALLRTGATNEPTN